MQGKEHLQNKCCLTSSAIAIKGVTLLNPKSTLNIHQTLIPRMALQRISEKNKNANFHTVIFQKKHKKLYSLLNYIPCQFTIYWGGKKNNKPKWNKSQTTKQQQSKSSKEVDSRTWPKINRNKNIWWKKTDVKGSPRVKSNCLCKQNLGFQANIATTNLVNKQFRNRPRQLGPSHATVYMTEATKVTLPLIGVSKFSFQCWSCQISALHS